jgi:glutaconyl-CoA/methylmalonyl-CoA decarboxylase subunit delta
MSILTDVGLSFQNIQDDHLLIFAVGYTVVFLSLAFLWFVFANLPFLLKMKERFVAAKRKRNAVATAELKTEVLENGAISGEEAAAIAMALHLYVNEVHDVENTILTIRKISRRYSPWNSKIYSVSSNLNKRF